MIDPLIRHQVYLNRYAGGVSREADELLRQLARDLKAKISAWDGTDYQLARMRVIEQEIAAMVGHTSAGIGDVVGISSRELASFESKFAVDLLGGYASASVVGVSLEQIESAIAKNPMVLVSGKRVQVLTPAEILETFTATATKDVTHVVRSGVVNGTTTQKIARDVSALVNSRTMAQSEAMVRTITLNSATQARNAVYEENSDILQGEEWVATLDSRTSLICASRDGEVYDVGQPPYPPAHYQCRSVRVPLVKEKYRIIKDGQRSSINGAVSDKVTYNSWLKTQPKSFQNDVLGVERARIFREGGITLDRFVDKRGVVLTLEQLKQKSII